MLNGSSSSKEEVSGAGTGGGTGLAGAGRGEPEAFGAAAIKGASADTFNSPPQPGHFKTFPAALSGALYHFRHVRQSTRIGIAPPSASRFPPRSIPLQGG
jgi:hypothetical protein